MIIDDVLIDTLSSGNHRVANGKSEGGKPLDWKRRTLCSWWYYVFKV
jgi:hypothetical protein